MTALPQDSSSSSGLRQRLLQFMAVAIAPRGNSASGEARDWKPLQDSAQPCRAGLNGASSRSDVEGIG
jgi:hypothetical protein